MCESPFFETRAFTVDEILRVDCMRDRLYLPRRQRFLDYIASMERDPSIREESFRFPGVTGFPIPVYLNIHRLNSNRIATE